jgi:hypothetical protein
VSIDVCSNFVQVALSDCHYDDDVMNFAAMPVSSQTREAAVEGQK